MAWFPRWTVGPSFFHSRAGARWIAAAIASVVFLGYVGWLHRGGGGAVDAGILTLTPPLQEAISQSHPLPPPTDDSAGGASTTPPLATHLPAWIDTPAPFTITTTDDDSTTSAAAQPPLRLHPRLIPAVDAFLARPALSHSEALAANEAHCPRAQLDAQVNQDQLREWRAAWTALTAANITAMRGAAAAFLERRTAAEGEGALLGPGFGPGGVAVERGSRGVVIAAGNKRTVERAVLCVAELRRLGWVGGVEVWHFEGELQGEEERGRLEGLGVAMHAVQIEKAPGQWKNFELKAEAVLRSSFDEVLFLDSDNFPLAEVEGALFEAELFTDPRGGQGRVLAGFKSRPS